MTTRQVRSALASKWFGALANLASGAEAEEVGRVLGNLIEVSLDYEDGAGDVGLSAWLARIEKAADDGPRIL